MSKIIDTQWRSGRDSVGIVLVQRAMGDFRAYIGVSKYNTDEKVDAQYIADYGAKLTYREAVGFFPNLVESNYAGWDKVSTCFG